MLVRLVSIFLILTFEIPNLFFLETNPSPSKSVIALTNLICEVKFVALNNFKKTKKTIIHNKYQNIKNKTGNLSETIGKWRSNWLFLLEQAYKIEVFSESSKNILLQVWPQLEDKINVKPHQLITPPRRVNSTKNLVPVMGVLGSIVYNKGAQILYEIARTVGDGLKIVIIGELDPSYSHEKMSVHGRFSRDQISDLAKHYSIDFWLIPSIWPETISYATHECLATELPVFAFDIGAQGDTVRNYSKGIVLPLSISTPELIQKLFNFKKFVQKTGAG